ncbi:hypothetical protein [Actinomadura sp. NBRC 104425]|uniref:hypothetical protein n=1 Tax=Actinomadura sp. NBRC 104425 TaxID=3032204 RepID=UPI0025523A56|nr:hypothetical protein [Actinomadura sp. NBRC 104425]
MSVRPWSSDAEMQRWVSDIGDAVEHTGDSPQLHAGIRAGLSEVLGTGTDVATWSDLLQNGRTFVADGRLIWIRPVLQDTSVGTQPDDAVRKYKVSFASMMSGGKSGGTVTQGFDGLLLSIFSVGTHAAASAAPGVPSIKASAVTKAEAGFDRHLIAGRKLFVSGNTRFTSGMGFKVFVDGVERPNDVRLPQMFEIDFPKELTAPGAPRPGNPPAERPAPMTSDGAPPRTEQRPSQASETINAVNTIPAVAALQRNLRGAGLPASTVKTVLDEIGVHLSEKEARNRSRLLFGGGIPTTKVTTSAGPAKRFNGHFSISAEITGLQYLGETEMAVRDDTGSGIMHKPSKEGQSKAELGFTVNYFGEPRASHGDTAGDGDRGLFQGGIAFPFSRNAGHSLAEQALGHTVLKREGRQARFKVDLQYTIETRSTTHDIPPVRTTLQGEISVPAPEAAQFEEYLTGAIRTPALRPPTAPDTGTSATTQPAGGTRRAPGPRIPVAPKPRNTAPPASANQPPAGLNRRPTVNPAHREPLALATRRGIGFAMPTVLPGAELVRQQVRDVIESRHNALSNGAKADWSQTDLDLATWLSRPALEADLPAVMAGIDRTFTLDGRRYNVTVRAHLTERIGGYSYDMSVNGRALMATGTSGHRNTELGVRASGGGGVRFGRYPFMRFTLGAWDVHGEVAYTGKNEFGGSAKSYRRTETTKQVDEHVYNVVYEVTVQPKGSSPTTWWIGKPAEVTAKIVVPEEHRPDRPFTQEELDNAGTPRTLEKVPAGAVPFSTAGSSGVYPAFHVIPELPRLAAEMYARANNLPASWLADRTNWPAGIKRITKPDQLAAFFSTLTSETGRIENLPQGTDGRKQSITVKLHVVEPRHQHATNTEIEQYAQGEHDHKYGHEWKFKVGTGFSAGPQFLIGSEQDGPSDSSHGDDSSGGHHGSSGGHHGLGGRIQINVEGKVDGEYKSEKLQVAGKIDITRATYNGKTHTYQTTPVFEITLHRWKGKERQRFTRILQVTDGMEMMVPDRRAHDLGLPTPDSTPPVPQPPTRHVPPEILAATSYPETLDTGQLLPRIKEWVRDQGILRETDRPNLVLREIESAFSAESIRNQHTTLLGSGVRRWIPIPRPFGATRYLWINVQGRVGAAQSQLPRDDVKLTLRGESQDEKHHASETAFKYSGAFQVRGRGGSSGDDGVHRHGGFEAKIEGSGQSSHGLERHDKKLNIYRGGTKDKTLEFNHNIRFRLEMGISTEPPEFVNVAVRLIRKTVIGGGQLLSGNDSRAGDLWYLHRPLISHHVIEPDAPDGIEGHIRLLVPEHVAALNNPPTGSTPAYGGTPERVNGQRQKWAGHDQDAVKALIENLHPWGVPFAAAIERWAALPASPYRLPDDLGAPGAWRVPGLDFTTIAGQRYMHFTGPELMRPRIKQLFNHDYQVPVGSRSVVVGVEITRAEPMPTGSAKDPAFKGRIYVQESEAGKEKQSSSRELKTVLGPDAGGDAETGPVSGAGGYEYGREGSEETSGELGSTDETNQEATRPYRYFAFDVDVYLQGPRGIFRVPVPKGLYGMLPLEKGPDGTTRLVDNLETRLPSIFGRRAATEEATTSTAAVPPTPAPPPAPTTQHPSDQPPSDQPPSTQPSSDQRPSDQHPSTQPSSDQRPSDQHPSTQPSSDQRPSDQHPSTQPSSDQRPSDQHPSGQPAEELSEQQKATLSRLGLKIIHVPAAGDGPVNALTNLATAETTAIGNGTRPATPAELRGYLSEALTADLARPAADRRFWPTFEKPYDGALTDEDRHKAIDLLTSPPGSADADEFTFMAAAAVLGLHMTVVRPDGTTAVFGPESGRPVTLVLLSNPGPFVGQWAPTEPVAASAPAPPTPIPVRPSRPPAPSFAPPTPPEPSGLSRGRSQTPRPVANLGVDPFAVPRPDLPQRSSSEPSKKPRKYK